MYNPGISYHGDEYIFRGLQALGAGIGGGLGDIGEGIADHIKEQKKIQEEKGFNQQVYTLAQQNNLISPEDDTEFQKTSIQKQNGMVHGWMVRMAEDAKAKYQQAQIGHLNAISQAETQNAMIRAMTAQRAGQPVYQQPVSPTQSPAPWNQQVGNWTAEGAIHPLPQQQPTAPQIATVPNPTGGDPFTFYRGQKGWSRIPLPADQAKTILKKGLSNYGLEPDDLTKLDFQSMDIDEEGGKSHVTGKTTDGKSFKIPQDKWNQLATIYKNTQAAPAKPLDSQTAAAILKEAGGDKAKARELARERGYTF